MSVFALIASRQEIAETFSLAPLSVTYRFDNPILEEPYLAIEVLPVQVKPQFVVRVLGRL